MMIWLVVLEILSVLVVGTGTYLLGEFRGKKKGRAEIEKKKVSVLESEHTLGMHEQTAAEGCEQCKCGELFIVTSYGSGYSCELVRGHRGRHARRDKYFEINGEWNISRGN